MVLRGPNPDWRTVWLGGLSPDDRREVRQAVRHGQRVSGPRLAPFVFGLGARWRRWIWLVAVFGLLQLVLISTWVYQSCVVHLETLFHRLSCGFFVLAGLTWITGVPLILRLQYQRLRQAEETNRQLLRRHDS